MIHAQMISPGGQLLIEDQILEILHQRLDGQFQNQRVLVLSPDHTRSLPLAFLFRSLVDVLHDAKQLDFMIALGIHPPLGEESIHRLVDITAEERMTTLRHVGLLNHAWHRSFALISLGKIEEDEIRQIAGENWHSSLPNEVDIRINKAVLEYDHIIKPNLHVTLASKISAQDCARLTWVILILNR